MASDPPPETVTETHAAESGSSTTNKLNDDSPNFRARAAPTLKTAASAVPPAKLATTFVEAPAVPQIT